jgi:hypothetical protein
VKANRKKAKLFGLNIRNLKVLLPKLLITNTAVKIINNTSINARKASIPKASVTLLKELIKLKDLYQIINQIKMKNTDEYILNVSFLMLFM